MNHRRPRYGLTIDTTTPNPKPCRPKPSSARHAAKTPPTSARSVQSEGISAIDIVQEFGQSRPASSTAARAHGKRSRLRAHRRSRQERNDANNIVTQNGNGRIETSSNNNNSGNVEKSHQYRPKFFNYEPSTAASPSVLNINSVRNYERPSDELSNKKGTIKSQSSPRKGQAQAPNKTASAPSPKLFAYENNNKASTPTTKSQFDKEANRINMETVYTPIHPPNTSQSTPKSQPLSPKQSTPKSQPLSPTSPRLFAYENPASPGDRSNASGILPSTSSASGHVTARLLNLLHSPDELVLRSRNKSGMKPSTSLNVVCNEDGFEVQDNLRNFMERDVVYRSKGNVRWGMEKWVEKALSNEESCKSEVSVNELGKNGWHRLMRSLHKEKEIGTSEAAATLDQLQQISILNSLPACDEYEALSAEKKCLLKELKALEKDRLCLERQFTTLESAMEEIDPRRRKDASSWTYRDFKDNISRVEKEDRKHLPSFWLEELNEDDSYKRRNYNNDELDALADSLKHQRGRGLALLMCDGNAKNSLIGRCYMNCIGKGRKDARVLSVEGPAILVPNGGVGVRYFGVTGCQPVETDGGGDATVGTCYFVKFDAGKSYHRGNLPVNLADRLHREKRSSKSLRYLSTGPSSYTFDGRSCAVSYYAEFDDGECWWGMADMGQSEEDNSLHKIYLEMDVHRVAFGADSTWIVISKDGDVIWKNIPQGLHDVLISRDAENGNGRQVAAPCEVSLGMGGSWFIRFMDDTIEYSLPTFAADVCDRLEAKGEVIRNVSLNVASYDCLVRYSSKR